MSIEARTLDLRNIRNIAPLVNDLGGRPRVMPAAFYASTTLEERAAFGVRHAAYCLPTEELVSWLKKLIGNRSAIEIGSGNGVLAATLNIPATDNCMQNRPDIAQYYAALGQPVVKYGPQVVSLAADEAVKLFKPQVVIASWVTHRYDPARHEAGGNQEGVVEEDIIRACETYVVIGNTHVHKAKSIWGLPHIRVEPPWLYSRAHNGSAEFIAVWGKPPTTE